MNDFVRNASGETPLSFYQKRDGHQCHTYTDIPNDTKCSYELFLETPLSYPADSTITVISII